MINNQVQDMLTKVFFYIPINNKPVFKVPQILLTHLIEIIISMAKNIVKLNNKIMRENLV
jgi:hypothetical protein